LIKFVYEGEGERTFQKGDCVLQPAAIVQPTTVSPQALAAIASAVS
jgi:hypothetical protein